ncbi:uncharacterized protein LOC115096125 [Rhinatrema bivittatum]|uniref:uncharacterized protein LOC115096125 n=1 Tax=Rhinatrema bivittatum TaxID=194408 RepID=UPI0011264648|nr:uncharacterized protein LOC115096125 [Rhinatrema bivittatum]
MIAQTEPLETRAAAYSGETTLSPPDSQIPPVPIPQTFSSPVSAELDQMSSIQACAGVAAETGSGEQGLDGGGVAERQTVGEPVGQTVSPNLFSGTMSEQNLLEPGAMNAIFIKPTTVTLDSLWELVAKLGMVLQTYSQQQNVISTKIDTTTQDLNSKFMEQQQGIQALEDKDKKIQETQSALIQERQILSRKIEQIENKLRYLNLRFLNFPKVLGEQPRSTLRKYLIDVLHIAPENIPVFNRVYFLPYARTRENAASQSIDMENLTAFLETSTPEIIERSTLLVSFIYEQDVTLIMRNYFQNMGVEFLGKADQIFPDLAKVTQERRRGFLALRQKPAL